LRKTATHSTHATQAEHKAKWLYRVMTGVGMGSLGRLAAVVAVPAAGRYIPAIGSREGPREEPSAESAWVAVT